MGRREWPRRTLGQGRNDKIIVHLARRASPALHNDRLHDLKLSVKRLGRQVFSFAILTVEVLGRTEPYADIDPLTVLQHVCV